MGFLDTFRKIILGKPVFTAHNQQPEAPAQAPTQQAGQQGPKVIPQVMIERWNCVEQGMGLHCEIIIRNYSHSGVMLDRIELLGVKDHLGNQIDRGEQWEFQFNLANRPKDTHLDECHLYFKDETGDYFLAKHQIEFEKQPDGTFSILRFRLLPPIRDV